MSNIKDLKESCGVFATFNAENAGLTTYYGLHALQHRGQDGCGIAWIDKEQKLNIFKSTGLLRDVFSDSIIKNMEGKSAIGHTRYATTGDTGIKNVQPFYFHHRQNEFAVAHNGNISNANELREELENLGSVFFGTSDTELFGHLLIRSAKKDIFNSLLDVLNRFEGAFSLVIIDKDGIYGVRDRWGFRPLVIGQLNSSWYIASETVALDLIGATFIRDVKPGEVIQINENGIKSAQYNGEFVKQSLCAMELIYFARPDSVIDGISVHQFRKESGRKLAQLFPTKDCEIVVPIPESSISAALGFAEQSKIPYEMGLVKNRYVARTFIEATQNERELSVTKKLNVSKSIVNGKNIVLIDDSIVRGTTIKKIINMLRKNGAKKIHMRVASPMIIAPSYYGINISSYKELLARHYKSEEEIAKYIGADSVCFLPIKTLEELAKPIGLDMCIFTDKYNTKISPELIAQARK